MELGPTARVFATTELLEMILEHLPPRDVVLAKRVCRVFGNCRITSTRLRDRISPPPGTDEWWAFRSDDDTIKVTTPEVVKLADREEYPEDDWTYRRPIIPHDLLFQGRRPCGMFRYYADELEVTLDLTKMYDYSSCMSLPLLCGSGVCTKIEARQYLYINGKRTAIREVSFWKPRMILFRDVWQYASRNGWDLTRPIWIKLLRPYRVVTESFLNQVRAKGGYKGSLLTHPDELEHIMPRLRQYISIEDLKNLRLVNSNLQFSTHRFIEPQDREGAFKRVDRIPVQQWIIDAQRTSHGGVIARVGQGLVGDPTKLASLHHLLNWQNGKQHRYALKSVHVYDTFIFHRKKAQTPCEQAFQCAAELELRLDFGVTRDANGVWKFESDEVRPLHILQESVDNFVTLPPTKELYVEKSISSREGHQPEVLWRPLHHGYADEPAGLIQLGEVLLYKKLGGGTGRLCLPGSVLVSKGEWNEMQREVEEITYEDVVQEMDRLEMRGVETFPPRVELDEDGDVLMLDG